MPIYNVLRSSQTMVVIDMATVKLTQTNVNPLSKCNLKGNMTKHLNALKCLIFTAYRPIGYFARCKALDKRRVNKMYCD